MYAELISDGLTGTALLWIIGCGCGPTPTTYDCRYGKLPRTGNCTGGLDPYYY